MRSQLVLVPAYFFAVSSYFPFFPLAGACEFQGQAGVKLYHFSDEMQADVAVSYDIVHTLPVEFCSVGGAWQYEQSLIVYSSGFPFLRFRFQSECQLG